MTRVPIADLRSRSRTAPLVALVVWVLVMLACAVSVPPSGGPEDKSPPRVTSSTPANDSTGVDPKSVLRIGFSEPMREERVERLVNVNPPIEIDHVRWDGNMMVIQPAHDLVRDTTYVVRIRPDYQDRHGVPGTQWHEFAFATGTAALDTARIEGRVVLKHAPAARAIVRCFRVDGNDTLNIERDRPARETTGARDGTFTLKHLPSNNARFVVMAFLDQNGNSTYDRDNDPAGVFPDTVVITAANPVIADMEIVLLDPRDPGGLKGTVDNQSGVDSARVMIAMYDAIDSTRVAYRAVCDSIGAYEVKTVRPGAYILRAFVDVRRDSLPGTYPCAEKPKGCPEPNARRAGWVRIKAAATATEPVLIIRKEEKP